MGTNGSAVGCGTKDEFGCAIITTAYVGDVGFSLNQHLGTIYVCLRKNIWIQEWGATTREGGHK